MSIAAELDAREAPPERLEVYVTVRMDEVDGSHEIVASTADVAARAGDRPRRRSTAPSRDGRRGLPVLAPAQAAGRRRHVNATLEEA